MRNFARVLVCSKAQDDEDEFFTASRRRSRALSFRLLFFFRRDLIRGYRGCYWFLLKSSYNTCHDRDEASQEIKTRSCRSSLGITIQHRNSLLYFGLFARSSRPPVDFGSRHSRSAKYNLIEIKLQSIFEASAGAKCDDDRLSEGSALCKMNNIHAKKKSRNATDDWSFVISHLSVH